MTYIESGVEMNSSNSGAPQDNQNQRVEQVIAGFGKIGEMLASEGRWENPLTPTLAGELESVAQGKSTQTSALENERAFATIDRRRSDLRAALGVTSMSQAVRIGVVFDLIAVDLSPNPQTKVTKKGHEALSWIALGKTSREVADILDLHPHAIDERLNTAKEGLGGKNRPNTVFRAFEERIFMSPKTQLIEFIALTKLYRKSNSSGKLPRKAFSLADRLILPKGVKVAR